MGLREITLVLLGTGAVLGIVGGLGVCSYNCRYYDKLKAYKVQWGPGTIAPVLQCALSSGIFGILRALVCIGALVLLIIGFNKLIVSVLFIVSAVLYLGELIPEAILLAKAQYGVLPDTDDLLGTNPKGNLCDEQSEWYKWADSYRTSKTEAQSAYVNGGTPQEMSTRQIHVAMVDSRFDDIPELKCGYCFIETPEYFSDVFTSSSDRVLAVIPDYGASKVPENRDTPEDCEQISLTPLKENHGWDSKRLTDRAIKYCKESLEGDGEVQTKDDMDNYYKKTLREYRATQSEQTIPGLYLINALFLGVQTFGFVAALVGAILSFIGGGGKDDPEP